MEPSEEGGQGKKDVKWIQSVYKLYNIPVLSCTTLQCTTFTEAQYVYIKDCAIKLAKDNQDDLLDIGVYGQFKPGIDTIYGGLTRDHSDGIWKLSWSTTEPTSITHFDHFDDLKLHSLIATGSLGNGTYLYTLPSKDGTLAVLSDIPSLADYVTINGTSSMTGALSNAGGTSSIDFSTNSLSRLDHIGIGTAGNVSYGIYSSGINNWFRASTASPKQTLFWDMSMAWLTRAEPSVSQRSILTAEFLPATAVLDAGKVDMYAHSLVETATNADTKYNIGYRVKGGSTFTTCLTIQKDRVGFGGNEAPAEAVDVTGSVKLSDSLKSGENTYTMPASTGTLALTSDIPSLTNYVTTNSEQTISAMKTFSTAPKMGSIKTASGFTMNIPNEDGNLVSDLAIQTLSFKTLITPNFASFRAYSDKALIYPPNSTTSSTLATLALPETLTNKTITSPVITTPVISSLYSSTSNGLISLPSSSTASTLSTLALPETLSNKTISSSSMATSCDYSLSSATYSMSSSWTMSEAEDKIHVSIVTSRTSSSSNLYIPATSTKFHIIVNPDTADIPVFRATSTKFTLVPRNHAMMFISNGTDQIPVGGALLQTVNRYNGGTGYTAGAWRTMLFGDTYHHDDYITSACEIATYSSGTFTLNAAGFYDITVGFTGDAAHNMTGSTVRVRITSTYGDLALVGYNTFYYGGEVSTGVIWMGRTSTVEVQIYPGTTITSGGCISHIKITYIGTEANIY